MTWPYLAEAKHQRYKMEHLEQEKDGERDKTIWRRDIEANITQTNWDRLGTTREDYPDQETFGKFADGEIKGLSK